MVKRNRLLDWDDAYLIGVAELDYEHKDLFDRISQIDADLRQRTTKEDIEECLGAIHARLEAHFALEEKYMRDHGFAGYVAHKAAHDELLDDILGAMERFREEPGLSYGERLMTRLKDWVIDHVLGDDQALAEVANRQAAAKSGLFKTKASHPRT
jgi:hemerythrin